MASSARVSFAEACGVGGPLRISAELEFMKQEVRQFETLRPFVRLGRDVKCDIRLEDPTISRRHAYFQVVCGQLLCVDLGSRKGIRWAQGPAQWGWLRHEEPIIVGAFRVTLLEPILLLPGFDMAPSKNPLRSEDDTTSSISPLTLEFLQPHATQELLRVRRQVSLIGRSKGCKIRFDDPGLAKFHCSLVVTPSGPWILDLVSRSGTKVNGEPVVYAPLEDGAHVEVGSLKFRVHCGEQPRAHAFRGAVQRAALPAIPVNRPHTLDVSPPVMLAGPTSNPVILSPSPPRGSIPADRSRQLPRVQEGSADNVLRAMMDQLTTFHQQMFQQNQQTITMMVQLFSRLHREHLELVREELARLGQLTEELSAVQQELSKYALPRQSPVSEPGKSIPVLEVPASPAQAEVHLASAAEIQHAPVAPAVTEKISPSPVVPPTVTNPEDIHAWLVERMAAIQSERQTLWERVCGALRIP